MKLTSASINIKRSNPFPLDPFPLSILSFCSVKKENSDSERILGTCVFFVGLQCPSERVSYPIRKEYTLDELTSLKPDCPEPSIL